ncbi:MAG: hypothetical protein HY724_02110 [Candidatus Rokubacteria bacterium]|nr:hypothetical protein [Candidatus Rokubacteria bacterium]
MPEANDEIPGPHGPTRIPQARTERRFFLSGLRARLFALVLLAVIPAVGMILYRVEAALASKGPGAG